MGFSFKNIGKFIDALDEVTDEVFKEMSKEAKKSAKSAGRFIDNAFDVAEDVYNETSKDFDKGLKRVGKFIDNNYDYIETVGDVADYAFETAAGAIEKVATFVVNVAKELIDILFIKEQVKQHNPRALRALILSKKRNAVDVGIFSNGELSEKMTINSDLGVKNEIYQGQVIEIYS